ncbi:uncharacterized protein LOC110865655 isoform X2 [Helianthus annuus]|uniref:uncharacterized protein LOC110865655 isoform X2 n=1 Tax=Helianthus annuus TaxID=4232 RepID=UPI001652E876|nr:uncharacterized protein LOC110865655 isoform X2 [Helianthus annuus]
MVGLYEFFYPGLKFESGDRGFSLSEFKLESIVRVGSLARTSKNLNEPTNKTIRKHNSKMASQSATSSVGVGSTATNASIVDYLDAAERIQHVESLEDENGVETDIHEEEVEMGMSSPLEED